MKLTGIYGLADPRTGMVVYVGRSVDIRARYRAHLRVPAVRWQRSNVQNWIARLKDVTREPPRLIVLELCGREHLDEREEAWLVGYHRSQPLINLHAGPRCVPWRQCMSPARALMASVDTAPWC